MHKKIICTKITEGNEFVRRKRNGKKNVDLSHIVFFDVQLEIFRYFFPVSLLLYVVVIGKKKGMKLAHAIALFFFC